MTSIYKQSKQLKSINGIKHGFFTKNGGVSSGVYESLNCSPSSDDDEKNIIENRRLVMASLGAEQATLFGVNQIHSTVVHTISSHTQSDFPDGDALITNKKGIALSVLGADCTPILFSDNEGNVIGAAHAGWRGAVTGIVEAVVLKMCGLGVKREAIQACIGPTIHQPSYEVQKDFIQQLMQISTIPVESFLLEKDGNHYFDLPAYLSEQCRESGIQSENLGLDTYVLKDEFFSYRRNTHEKVKDYGRQISVIALL
jgi:YfiH family protein